MKSMAADSSVNEGSRAVIVASRPESTRRRGTGLGRAAVHRMQGVATSPTIDYPLHAMDEILDGDPFVLAKVRAVFPCSWCRSIRDS